MKKIYIFLTFLLSGLLASGSAFAAGQAKIGFEEGEAHSTGHLIGLPVQDLQGQQIGTLEEILVDLNENRIAYGIVRVNEFSHVVPWEAITSPNDGTFLTLEADRQTVTGAPSLLTPGQLDQELGQQIHEHYGVSPYWVEDVVEFRDVVELQHMYPDGFFEGYPYDLE